MSSRLPILSATGEGKELASIKRVSLQFNEALKKDQLENEVVGRILRAKQAGERPLWQEISD